MDFINTIAKYISVLPAKNISWNLVDAFFQENSFSIFSEMKNTKQNPIFHGEGDVYTHTQMVCKELTQISNFKALSIRHKTELFLAALLHDIGKVKTTRLENVENGNFISPHHSSIGSQIVREFLWKKCALCGTPEKQNFRETICNLVRYHMLPVHVLERENPQLELRKIASIGELSPDFSLNLLFTLSEADVKGRIANDIDEELYQIQLFRMLAEELQCFKQYYLFSDSFTKHAYLSGRNIQPNQSLYDDTWGEVIMMSGLPGTGKDTWISKNVPELPVISLDEIRKELRIKPTENQSIIIHTTQERTKEFLRQKRSFILNATNLTKDIRKKYISLFERYNARVRIVYLETDWDIRVKRNAERENIVPENVIEKMLEKISLPTSDEAQTVEWIFV